VTASERAPALAPWRERYAAAATAADLQCPVVVGCSGGADSVALLALAADAGLDPIAAHVDHGLRPAGNLDRDHVAALAARLGARFDARTVDVAPGTNLEERARDARYEALEAARVECGASAILVAHTTDDQAETVLLNILRGAAGTGLSGMPSRRGLVVRPLLGFRRAETEALCAALGLPVLHDPMNDDEAFRRVAVRRRVLPMLAGVAGRDLVPVLARQADLLREESAFLDELARAAWPGPDGTSARALAELSPVLARRAVRQWLGPPPPSSAEVTRVLQVAASRHRATELSGGRRVRRSAGRLHLDA
jgi:tRNA(Ile)-lysidine synthase